MGEALRHGVGHTRTQLIIKPVDVQSILTEGNAYNKIAGVGEY